jgi:tRNA 2-thiouridine synthesizing protein D
MSTLETVTIVINEAAYGKERAWNALRLAMAMMVKDLKVNVFLLEDGVTVAKRDQHPPEGYYNLEKMLSQLVQNGAKVRACSTCLQARGLSQSDLVLGVEAGKLLDLVQWIKESKSVLSF